MRQKKKEKPNSRNLLVRDLLNKWPWKLLYQFIQNKWESKSCFLKELPWNEIICSNIKADYYLWLVLLLFLNSVVTGWTCYTVTDLLLIQQSAWKASAWEQITCICLEAQQERCGVKLLCTSVWSNWFLMGPWPLTPIAQIQVRTLLCQSTSITNVRLPCWPCKGKEYLLDFQLCSATATVCASEQNVGSVFTRESHALSPSSSASRHMGCTTDTLMRPLREYTCYQKQSVHFVTNFSCVTESFK